MLLEMGTGLPVFTGQSTVSLHVRAMGCDVGESSDRSERVCHRRLLLCAFVLLHEEGLAERRKRCAQGSGQTG